ncbi:MAG: carboxypeptidase-like regulatory domain-containing protein [Planctomycetia bacterium]|nr:carboxypeptidase-like regulatory domain-containing protein [Planctomycetia bacterium]
MSFRTITHLLIVFTLLAFFIGCGAKGPKLCKCTGTVTLDGAPVEKATVCFTNTSMSAPASAQTDAQGHFELQSQAGSFQVAILKLEGGATPENPYAPSKHLLPEKYANGQTSTLTAEVTGTAANDVFQFDLKK